MQQQPFAWGRQEDFDAAANREQHFKWSGDSHGEPLSHNTTVGNQGIRTRYAAFKNWNKNWVGLAHPASQGSLSTGASLSTSTTGQDCSISPVKPAGTIYGHKFSLAATGVTWTVGTLTLGFGVGALSSYTYASGDYAYIIGGTGATAGWYPIASKSGDNLILSTGTGLSGSNQTDYRVVAVGRADTIIDGLFCNDVMPLVFGANVADAGDINSGGLFGWFNNTAGDYFSGAAWMQSVTLKGRVLFCNSTNPTTLKGSFNHSSSNAVGTFVHPGAGNTLQYVESDVPSHASADVRLYLKGAAPNEAGTNFNWAGVVLYKYDSTKSATLKIADGSTWNTVSHAGWSAQNFVDRITEQALYEYYLATFPPSLIIRMVGHNATSAENTDIDGANDGTVLNNLIAYARRELSAAERAKAALGLTYRTRYMFVVPWLASAAGGLNSVARGIAWRNRMISAAKSVGGSCASLFDYFNQANPLMNTSHLHFDAVQSSGNGPNCDCRTVMNGLMAIWGSRVPVMPLRIPRP